MSFWTRSSIDPEPGDGVLPVANGVRHSGSCSCAEAFDEAAPELIPIGPRPHELTVLGVPSGEDGERLLELVRRSASGFGTDNGGVAGRHLFLPRVSAGVVNGLTTTDRPAREACC